MGPTGTGKSTVSGVTFFGFLLLRAAKPPSQFVKAASGLDGLVGTSLESCTQDITPVEAVWQMNGGEELRVVFVGQYSLTCTDHEHNPRHL